MSKLWVSFLKGFNKLGDLSGCHQIPERCFKIKGYIFPICARCTGVVLGEAISLTMLLLGYKLNILTNIILLLIMGLDWFIQYINIIESTNMRRFITGILGGYAIINLYYYIIRGILNIINLYIQHLLM